MPEVKPQSFPRVILASVISMLPILLLAGYVHLKATESREEITAALYNTERSIHTASTEWLYNSCLFLNADAPEPDADALPSATSSECLSFIRGFLNGMRAADNAILAPVIPWCIRKETRWEDIGLAYVRWHEKHPEFHKQPAFASLYSMMKEEFACENAHSP